MTIATQPGRPYPLGATLDATGVNFAVFSEFATAMDLCLFDDAGDEQRIAMTSRTSFVWHTHLTGIAAGQKYGLRAHGPYAPRDGHRFNPNKLLVDPYARMLSGRVVYSEAIYGFSRPGGVPDDDAPDDHDDSAGVPKSVVVDSAFDWGGDVRPAVPWTDTVIYELHVGGMTKLHPHVRASAGGTYTGLASDAIITHLKTLGVTAVELLPIQAHADEPGLAERGMLNYWGYSTLAYFAPDPRYAAHPGDDVREFKSMVKALHAAGIEVILDVVYNHTCEGDALGPTLSLRGLDNRTYYRLKKDARLYEDFSGCGNTLDMSHPQTLKLVMDSLRYWVTEMHVDGFRFDLASALGREAGTVDRLSTFFDIVHQDPVLSCVKLIAEPWDLGPDGYQVGNFPLLWSEWNGRFRDTVRRFWKGDPSVVADFGYRLTGSSDLFGDDGRRPHASINFVTAHDGFTLRDLVSYEKKHNEANGEHNRDGSDDNQSMNFGVEGETRDPKIVDARLRQVRNFLATLLLSQGVPMLTMGDEIGRTQRGNNNAYCQNNELSWVDWRLDDQRRALFDWTSKLIALRASHPVFRRLTFFSGHADGAGGAKDIAWIRRDGAEMTGDDWIHPSAATIGFILNGSAAEGRDAAGAPMADETFVVLKNASPDALVFHAPAAVWGAEWKVVVDTAETSVGRRVKAGEEVLLVERSVIVLERT
jgi:isoamylase